MAHVHEMNPHLFAEDAVEAFRRNVWVHPFHEDDPMDIVRYGSSPHAASRSASEASRAASARLRPLVPMRSMVTLFRRRHPGLSDARVVTVTD
jgi:hypothetical protein